jgi:hypothetical protein
MFETILATIGGFGLIFWFIDHLTKLGPGQKPMPSAQHLPMQTLPMQGGVEMSFDSQSLLKARAAAAEMGFADDSGRIMALAGVFYRDKMKIDVELQRDLQALDRLKNRMPEALNAGVFRQGPVNGNPVDMRLYGGQWQR